MSNDAWDDRRKAQEEGYFDKQNKLLLERLNARKGEKARLSPITGKPMEQKQLMGVIVDQCPDTGGIWLDAGELEQIMEQSKQSSSLFGDFLNSLIKK